MSNGKRGGQIGNTNAANAKMWTAAIQRALDKRSEGLLEGKKAIDELAENLLELCDNKELGALKEFGDRMEGKPAQSVLLGNDPDNPITKVENEIIDPKKKNS